MAQIKLELDITPFTIPLTVSLIMAPGKRSDGFKVSPTLLISELDADILSDMCDKFRTDVFEIAGKQDPKICEPSSVLFVGHSI